MLTIAAWKEMIEDIRFEKEFCKNQPKSEYVDLYLGTLAAICFTPIVIAVDVIILPFEIGYFFFERWIKKG